MEKLYTLPKLPYDYKALAPYISEDQLTLHHTKHHQAYVTGANAIFEKFDKARKEKTDFDIKATAKELSFHIGGIRLHTLFWQNLAPAGKGGGGLPKGDLAKAIDEEFGGFDRFKKEFSTAATSVEGSGWAALSYCYRTGRPLIMQVEKHNMNVFPGLHDPDGPGCLGACLLPRLPERPGEIRRCILEHRELGRGRKATGRCSR